MNSKEFSAAQIINFIRTKKEDFWLRHREGRALKLFHLAAERVPAYRDFLKKNKIRHQKIKTFKDFQLVPQTNKKDYLRQYPLEQLSWDGTLKKHLIVTSTSGSTGEPFYFPRDSELEWESSIAHELFIGNSHHNNSKGPTLVIIGFSMGVWIGGLITYKAFEMLSQRGFPVSIITPGINKEEIFKALRLLAPNYSQTILTGYPPFVKDILDEAAGRGINLKRLNLRLLFAAEPFTEKFRDYVVKKAGVKNALLDTMNIYGSADIGTMAFETPLSILIRRLAVKKLELFEEIFSSIHRTPTLAQYNPLFITFEAPEGEILLTGNNAVPLIRYAIGDRGGVFSFSQLDQIFRARDIDLMKEVASVKIQGAAYELPLIFVYERIDFSTTLYGLQIYPETIREVLLEKPLHKYLTGKFTMLTKYNRMQDQYLEINLELRKGKKASAQFKHQALAKIVTHLRLKNSEFCELSNQLKDRVFPRLIFWPAEHPLHFRPGVKQKWVKK